MKTAAARALLLPLEQRLWREEITGIREIAATLDLAARIATRLVLESLASDRSEAPATRRDALELLELLDYPGRVTAAA